MFRLLLACQMLLLYFSYAVAGVQVRDMKLTDPAVKACLIASSNEIDLSHDKLLSASVGDQLVVVWFGRKSDSEDPIKHLMCLFELNEDNKFVLKLIPGKEMTQLEEVQKDIEYLGLKPGEPGYESYQIKLELAGKALAEKKCLFVMLMKPYQNKIIIQLHVMLPNFVLWKRNNKRGVNAPYLCCFRGGCKRSSSHPQTQ